MAKQYVDHTCTLLEVEQTQANTPGQKTGARLPATYYVYDLMWNGKRYALRKRFSDFKSLDKALRPLLEDATMAADEMGLLPKLPTDGKLWRTDDVIQMRGKVFAEYLQSVMPLAVRTHVGLHT